MMDFKTWTDNIDNNDVDKNPEKIRYIREHPVEIYKLIIHRENVFKRLLVEKNTYKQALKMSIIITGLIALITLLKVAGYINW